MALKKNDNGGSDVLLETIVIKANTLIKIITHEKLYIYVLHLFQERWRVSLIQAELNSATY